ncbi:MAG: DUF475 domain-containing protein [Saprospiraceae bacterium]
MNEQIQAILSNPETSIAIVINLILIESLLSIDNAAVLAVMVMDLKEEERKRALKYGIVGAYVFRGICLIFAAWLIKFWWLKPVGGLYLIYLTYSYFHSRSTPQKSDDTLNKEEKWLYRITFGLMGKFWATVALVEIMDLAFSIDNVFAAVAFSNNIILIWTGVFIGILAMRFVAQGFVQLLQKFPFLEISAFMVIAVLGLKLMFSTYVHFYPADAISIFMDGEQHPQEGAPHKMANGEILTSTLTLAIFVLPILWKLAADKLKI